MRYKKYIASYLIILFVLIGCGRTIYIKPNDLSFAGITLYPNHTYDIIYSEHDVGGVSLNFGKYNYRGDTLILQLNKEEYINKLTKPILRDCEKEGLLLQFKEYISPYEKDGLMSIYWFDLKVKGISNAKDTTTIWETNTLNNQTNLNQIFLDEKNLKDITHIWVEIYNSPTTNPIRLPADYNCLNITIPLINVIGSQVWDKRIMWGMDEFIIKESNKHYMIKSIKRNSEYKLKKASNNR